MFLLLNFIFHKENKVNVYNASIIIRRYLEFISRT